MRYTFVADVFPKTELVGAVLAHAWDRQEGEAAEKVTRRCVRTCACSFPCVLCLLRRISQQGVERYTLGGDQSHTGS